MIKYKLNVDAYNRSNRLLLIGCVFMASTWSRFLTRRPM